MATRAERLEEELDLAAHQRRKPAPPAKKKPPVERFSHNDAPRLEHKKKAAYAIEPGVKRSRKSTRGGSDRLKPDAALRLTARGRTSSPAARARARR